VPQVHGPQRGGAISERGNASPQINQFRDGEDLLEVRVSHLDDGVPECCPTAETYKHKQGYLTSLIEHLIVSRSQPQAISSLINHVVRQEVDGVTT
jgi:hypothetical protein